MTHALAQQELALYALNAGATDAALILYLTGYVFLVFSLAGVLGCLLSTFRGTTQPHMVTVSGLHARVRWLLVYLFLSLAGLPPFFFLAVNLVCLVLSCREAHT